MPTRDMKLQRPGPKPVVSTRTSTKGKQRTSRGRTPRACDRCRIKKAKCDGGQVCKTCRAGDTPCAYSARRREARNYYCQMREVTDKALQRLYWACREGTGFPGDIPDQSTNIVSTTAILKGLGLIKPDFDEFELPKDSDQPVSLIDGPTGSEHHPRSTKPGGSEELDDHQSIMSLHSTISSPHISSEHAITTSSHRSMSRVTTSNEEIDMKEQFVAFSPSSKPIRPGRSISNPFFHTAETITEPQHTDIDAYLDTSFCSPPSTAPQSSFDNTYQQSMPFPNVPPIAAIQLSLGPSQQSPPALIRDSFLSPWPGYLSVAHQAVAI